MSRSLRQATLAGLFLWVLSLAAYPQRPSPDLNTGVDTEGGSYEFPSGDHPLSFWTDHPLDRKVGVGLMLGFPAPDGRPLMAADYRCKQTVTNLGTIGGHTIIQIILFIYPSPRVVAAGYASTDDQPRQWKTLLVQTGHSYLYKQIYGLQFGQGIAMPFKSAAIYGTGKDRILATYEPDTGNGGGCWDGYWWFDRTGAHPVDFAPLNRAMEQKVPPNTTFTTRCWAVHPKTNSIQSGIQRTDAECHACGYVGDVTATFRIRHGEALPISITYTPSPNPD